MKKLTLLAMLLILSAQPVSAADPSGDWVVEDGVARIRIAICDGSLWGVVGWERTPGQDTNNPDPAKRSRPTLGMPILIDMKPSGTDKWSGQIYNAKNGKMYQASVELQSDTALKVRGCVLGGLFCGGETWSRFVDPSNSAAGAPSTTGAPAKPAKSKAKAKTSAPDGAVASSLSGSVCSRIGGVAGPSH